MKKEEEIDKNKEENNSSEETKDEIKNNNEDEVKSETKEENKNEDEPQEEESLETVNKKLNVLQEKYVKVYADFDNSKKRLEKEKWNAIDYAIEGFAKDLLNAFDSLEMALKSAENTEADPKELLEKLIEGLKLTSTQFENIMIKNNIEQIETDGDFDPNMHNAIMQVDAPDEKKSGDIVEVMQQGYKLKERVIRAAMVSVAK